MRTRNIAGFVGIAGLVAAAGLSIAHDEDWRKLADKLPPVEGEIYRLGDRVERDGDFDALNMVCYSQFPLNTFGLGSSAGNDCWGYVSPSGREYAIMGLSNGYGFVEITDPVNATIVDTVNGPESSWHDVKVIGNYAYGVSEAGSGIQVMDLSDIDNGNVTLVRNSQTGGHSTSHNIVANPQSGSLWVVGANIGSGGLVHVSLANPSAPQISGGFTSDGYCHDAQVVTINPGDPQAGSYLGKEIAFMANEDTLTIADVTNPNAPTQISRTGYSARGYTHQCWLSEDRQYIYLNDELDEANGLVSTTTTRVWNISNLASPQLVGTFSTGKPSIDHNLYAAQGLIFESNYRTGLRVFDPSNDPINPVEIAYFDTFPGSDSAAFNGAWSNYPFFPSGTIIVSDIERGLFVLGLDLENLKLAPLSIPNLLNPDGGDTVTMTIQENNVTLDGSTVEMVVNQGASQQTVPGTDMGGGTWSFTMPPVDCGEEVTFSMQASTTGGANYTLPSDGSSYSALVSSGLVATLIDDAETNIGWTVSGVTSQLSGGWSRNVPNGWNRGDPTSDADGSGNAYLTGWSSSTDNTDVDDGSTILTSPTFDLSTPGLISYSYWINDVASGAFTPEDGLFVEVSTNNGGAWTRIRSYTAPNAAWLTDSINIETEIGLTSQGRVRFVASDLGAQNVVEAGMDHFVIEANTCTPTEPCPVDLNGDGIADNGDIGAFVTLFLAGDLAADFNGDGILDNGDIGAFVTLFLAGC